VHIPVVRLVLWRLESLLILAELAPVFLAREQLNPANGANSMTANTNLLCR
jgi:hypothetical protein